MCDTAQQHMDFTRSGSDVLYVCEIHSKMENPFKQNNSHITVLVQGQVTASIAFISPKNIVSFDLILASLRWHRFLHTSLPDFAINDESPSSLWTESICSGWICFTLHLRNPFFFFYLWLHQQRLLLFIDAWIFLEKKGFRTTQN